MTASSVVAFTLAAADVAVIAGGAALVAFLMWFFFGAKQARRAAVRDGVQEVEITVKGGYTPEVIELEQGVPARLTFNRQESGECTSRVVFPDFNISRALPAFARPPSRSSPTGPDASASPAG